MQNHEGEKHIGQGQVSGEGRTQFSEQESEAKTDAILGYIEGVVSGLFTESRYTAPDGETHVIIKNDSDKVLYDDTLKNYAKYLDVANHSLNARMVENIDTDLPN